MKYCTNCGEKLEDKVRVCPNCNEVFEHGISSDSVITIPASDNSKESENAEVSNLQDANAAEKEEILAEKTSVSSYSYSSFSNDNDMSKPQPPSILTIPGSVSAAMKTYSSNTSPSAAESSASRTSSEHSSQTAAENNSSQDTSVAPSESGIEQVPDTVSVVTTEATLSAATNDLTEADSQSSTENISTVSDSAIRSSDDIANPAAESREEQSDALISNPQVSEQEASSKSSDTKKEKQKKKSGKKLPIAIVAVLMIVLLVGGGAFAAFSLFKSIVSPKNQFLYHSANLFNQRVKPLLDMTMLRDGKLSTDLTLSARADNVPELASILNDSSIVMKIDSDENHLLSNVEVNLKGTSIINAMLTYDSKTTGFYFPQVDDKYYVGDTKKIWETLGDRQLSEPDLSKLSQKDWDAFAKSMAEIASPAFTKKNVTTEKVEGIKLIELDDTFDGTLYTFTPTAEDLEKSILLLADKIELDESFRKTLAQASLSATSLGYYYGALIPEDIEKQLLSTAQEIKEDPKTFLEDFEEGSFVWSIGVEKNTVRMMSIVVADEYSLHYESNAGESDGNFSEILYARDFEGEIETALENRYSKKGSQYEGDLNIVGDYNNHLEVHYNIDLNQKYLFLPLGNYDFTIPEAKHLKLLLEVKRAEGNSINHTLKVDNTRNKQALFFMLNATAKSSAQKPNVSPTDISDYDRGQIENLFDEIALQTVEGVQSVLFDLNYFGK
ncbi:MAG: zinc ribbon domain-containing protein [Peptostreptococcaceae bacterium]|nr:zinc ribbon domain-containing protein [Peptostreptococcaceae bacterium]